MLPEPIEIDESEDFVYYANRVINYHLGFDWMRPFPRVSLTAKEAQRARQTAYKWLRENCPERFPKGHRFN